MGTLLKDMKHEEAEKVFGFLLMISHRERCGVQGHLFRKTGDGPAACMFCGKPKPDGVPFSTALMQLLERKEKK